MSDTKVADLWHRRVNDFEWIDKIELSVIPRWKDSHLSGAEWRQHVEVRCFFKGLLVTSFGCSEMKVAVAMIPARVFYTDNGASKEWLAREHECCDQPSCSEPPVAFLRPKRLTDRSGSFLDPAEQYGTYYRKFCERHKRRGDCALEDADENYESIPDPRKPRTGGAS